MHFFYSDVFTVPLPDSHRFPMDKYTMLRERLTQEGIVERHSLHVSPAASDDELLLVHTPDYLAKVTQGKLTEQEVRRIGFPWSPELVERSRRSVGGTIAACRSAVQDGIAANLAGGTHHAYPGHGEGYCVFNDVAVAVRAVQAEGIVNRALIIDLDVHQGNGSAVIFRDDQSVFTLSIHGARNFPFHKEQSDLDIALPDGTEDTEYLQALETGLPEAIERARADFAIYLAGADPYQDDRLGRMSLSTVGLAARDHMVFEMTRRAQLPVAIVMSGGYARRVEETVAIHLQTLQIALERKKNGYLQRGHKPIYYPPVRGT